MKYIPFLFTLLFFVACSNNDIIETIDPEEVEESSSSDFADIKAGDKYTFSMFLGESFGNSNNNFRYTNDFLIVEVLEVSPDGIRIKESLDPTSDAFTNESSRIHYLKDAVFYNKWIIENDSIRIESIDENPKESILFLDSYAKINLDLDKFEDEEVTINGWQTSALFGDLETRYYIKDFELLGKTYDHLNVEIRNGPMAYDGNGNTYIYNKENGFVRVFTISAWTGTSIGWDLME